MVVHGQLTLGEILNDELLLYLVASHLRLENDTLARRLKKAIAGIYSEDTPIEDVEELPYVPDELWETTVGDALLYDSIATIAEWSGLSEREVLAELKDANKRTKVSRIFRFNWPPKAKVPRERTSNAKKAAKAVPAKKSAKATSAKKTGTNKLAKATTATSHVYDFAFTFAGENRVVVKELVEKLKAEGVSIFYDEFEEHKLWGKDLYEYLAEIYRNKARFCIMVISEHYAAKVWTNHERKAAQARAFTDSKEYILPLRLDDTDIPGIHPTMGYVDLRKRSIGDVVNIALRKLHET